MTSGRSTSPSALQRGAWLVVLAVSALLLVYGVVWYFIGPEIALDNIAERTSLAPDDFRQGAPSAFDVISVVARQQAAFAAGVGLLMLFVGWQGYRHGSGWVWGAAWVLVLAIAAAGLSFVLAAGAASQGLLYLALAGLVLVALIVTRPTTADDSAVSVA